MGTLVFPPITANRTVPKLELGNQGARTDGFGECLHAPRGDRCPRHLKHGSVGGTFGRIEGIEPTNNDDERYRVIRCFGARVQRETGVPDLIAR